MSLTALAIACVSLVLVSAPVSAQDYETPGSRPTASVLRPEAMTGPHYSIAPTVVSYGFMNHYTVDSDYGAFEVTGDLALRKLLHEIQAITSLKDVRNSKVFAKSLVHSAARPLHLGKQLITHPVDTVTGVPKGVFTLFGNVGEGVATTAKGERDPTEDANAKQILQVSSYKREWAQKLGVDVYSSNKVLQKELNSVGWAGTLGNLSLTALTMPISAPAAVALKQIRLADQLDEASEQLDDYGNRVDEMIAKDPPSRLKLINAGKFEKMGIEKALADAYLASPHFTPRHDTVIATSLEALEGAKGRELVLQLALEANVESDADFVQHLAQTLRGYHHRVSPIETLRLSTPFLVARAENGNLVVPFPLDYGVWSQRAETALAPIVARHREEAAAGGGRLEFWTTGSVSPKAREKLAERGMWVIDHIDTRMHFLD
jgi:hypothetical protein